MKRDKETMKPLEIRAAAAPGALTLEATATVEIEAAAAGRTPKRPTFLIDAYGGGSLLLAGWFKPVVIDLKGLRGDRVTVLKDHDETQIVGQGTGAIGQSGVSVAGKITGDYETPGEPAHEVVLQARNGFVWSASVGVSVERVENIEIGVKVRVNGRRFTGPLVVIRQSRLGEVSFVSVGADESASVKLAARAASRRQGGRDMDFDKWVEAMGLEVDGLNDEQKDKLRAKYDAKQKAEADAKAAAPPPPEVDPPPTDSGDLGKRILEAKHTQKVEAIADRLSTGCGLEQLERVKAVRDLAIKERWATEKAEAEMAHAKRPVGSIVQTHEWAGDVTQAEVVEASLAAGCGLGDLGKQYPEHVIAAAQKRWPRHVSLVEALVLTGQANGQQVSTRSSVRDLLMAAFGGHVQAAMGFSTIDIGGILSNVANKFLAEGFLATEMTWRRICGIRNARDFKLMRTYRLTGDDTYQQVAPGGEIKHGTLGEDTYYNQLNTYGRMFTIDRRDIVNDDLDAISTVPRKLGRGSGNAINDVFWAAFLDDAAFFAAVNNNLIVGADGVLSIDGLTAALTLFHKQVDSDDRPLGISPRIMLVPVELEPTGRALLNSQELRQGGADPYPTANPHAGREIVLEKSSYLSNANFENYSETAWYLLADPAVLSVVQVAFLDGRETPTIETADADFNVLGISMRGYHDFGVALQDYRGGVKCDGESGS